MSAIFRMYEMKYNKIVFFGVLLPSSLSFFSKCQILIIVTLQRSFHFHHYYYIVSFFVILFFYCLMKRSRCALDHEKLDGSLMSRTIFLVCVSLLLFCDIALNNFLFSVWFMDIIGSWYFNVLELWMKCFLACLLDAKFCH